MANSGNFAYSPEAYHLELLQVAKVLTDLNGGSMSTRVSPVLANVKLDLEEIECDCASDNDDLCVRTFLLELLNSCVRDYL